MISKTYSPHQGVAVSSSSIHCIPLAKQMSILFTQDARWSQESNGLQTNGVQAAWSVGDVMLVFCYFCWLWDWRWLTLSCRSQKKDILDVLRIWNKPMDYIGWVDLEEKGRCICLDPHAVYSIRFIHSYCFVVCQSLTTKQHHKENTR